MSRLSFVEYNQWKAYYRIEPFGELRQDFRIGQVCATAANIVGVDQKKPLEATDFIPTYDSIKKAEEEETVEHMNNSLKKSFAALKELAKSNKRVNI